MPERLPMLYVFDLDGVIYRMDEPVPGAVEAVRRLKARGDSIYYLTNNSSRTRDDYARKLAAMGIEASREEVMTSAFALGQWFRARDAAGTGAFVIGESGLREEVTSAGLRIRDSAAEGKIDYAVVGWDRAVTYAKLAEAHRAVVEGGAQFIATNRDATYPDAGGRTLPGSGALVAALATCTGVEPVVIGKPEPFTLQLILERSGRTPGECIVVGDRLDTDILIGNRLGARTTLVLTGVHSESDVDCAPEEWRPSDIIPTLRELP
jgi:4-nitrophenyl phosphatase